MGRTIYANDGSVWNFGDLNTYFPVGGHAWSTFYTMKSDPIFARNMKSLVSGLPYPNIFSNIDQSTFDAAKSGDAATIYALENEGYWFVGDWFNGGLVFFEGPDSDHVGYLLVRAMQDCPGDDFTYWFYFGNNSMPLQVSQQDPSDGTYKNYDNALIFVDQIKLNGRLEPSYWGTVEACPEIGHWEELPLPGQVIYERNNVNDSIQRTSIEAGDFVNNLITFYQTTFMVDSFNQMGPDGLPQHDRYEWWNSAKSPKPDPYAPGGYSGPGGGDGTFDNSSIDIPVPGLPPDTLLNCGVIKMYQPSETEMRQFINYIYSAPQSVIDNFKKIWVNPMDSIISFSISPISPDLGTAEEVKFCGQGSNISMNPLSSQYKHISCGSLKKQSILNAFFGSALDYSNYTHVSIFLPFIGFCPLPADEVINAGLSVDYNLDFLTGECVAFVHVTKDMIVGRDDSGSKPDNPPNDMHISSVLHTYKGNFLASAPLTGNNYQNLYQSVLNSVTSIGTGLASSMTGNIAGGIAGVASSIGSNLLGQKVTYQRSGTMAGNGGQLGEYTPYLLIERPIQSLSSDFVDKRGYPSNCCNLIKNVKGYFEIIEGTFQPELDLLDGGTIAATKEEVDMIAQILETGAIYNE